MDEKELMKRAKNSFKAKKSKAEILAGFQKRGYKLAYADKLITKLKRPKKMAITLFVAVILFLSLSFSAYAIFSNQQQQLLNPLSGQVVSSSQSSNNQIPHDQIEITPEFISFLLNEIGAWELHRNPLTFKNPIINFKIDDREFYSEMKSEIKTYEGLSESADLQFNTNKPDLMNAIGSPDPVQVFKQSIISGNTQVELKASKIELFAKGYLKLYDSLKQPSPL